MPGPLECGGRAAGYFTSATGITFYDGDALPAEYADCFFIGDVGSNLVHRKRLVDGSIQKTAIRTETKSEFLRSVDNWFRPVQFAVGPDGSLLVLDMYRETVEHPASLPPLIQQHLDLASGNDLGRIYRVAPRDFETPVRKLPGEATTDELVAMLGHANGWHRATAARLLYEQRPAMAAELLTERGLTSLNPIARIRAMYLLGDLSKLQALQLSTLMRDETADVRIHAVRIAERFVSDSVITTRLREMADDADERVRFQVALSLGQLDGVAAADAIARLAVAEGSSHWMSEALGSSASKCRGEVIARLLTSLARSRFEGDGGKPLLLELIREVARDTNETELTEVCRLVSQLADDDLDLLGDLLLRMAQGPEQQIDRVKRSFGDDGTKFESLVSLSVGRANSIAMNEKQALAARVGAISVLRLADFDKFNSVLPTLLALRQPPKIRQAALSTAESFSNDKIAVPILQQLASMSPEIRTHALQVLLARPSWTLQLLGEISIGNLSPVMLDAATRQNLLRHPQVEVADRARQILGLNAASSRATVVDEYAMAIDSLTGDVTRGRAIFRKSCVACHRLESEGNEIGPNLAAFANRGSAAILLNLLDPNREVDSRYLAYTALLEDGRTVVGIIASETASSITLENSEGKSISFSRDEVDEMQSTTKSLMPERLEDDISHQGMADLIAYLLGQRG